MELYVSRETSFGMWVVCTHNHAFHVQQYGYKGSLAYIYTYFLMFFVYIYFFNFLMLHQLKHLTRNVALNDHMFLEIVQNVEDCFERVPLN
jgi:hypothetical protein